MSVLVQVGARSNELPHALVVLVVSCVYERSITGLLGEGMLRGRAQQKEETHDRARTLSPSSRAAPAPMSKSTQAAFELNTASESAVWFHCVGRGRGVTIAKANAEAGSSNAPCPGRSV